MALNSTQTAAAHAGPCGALKCHVAEFPPGLGRNTFPVSLDHQVAGSFLCTQKETEAQTSNAPKVTELVGGSARVLNQTSRGGVLVLVHLRSAEWGGERREFWPES